MMLKNLFQISIIALVLIGCDTNDDGFYNETYVNAQNNLVAIQSQTTPYSVNDLVSFSAVIPNLLQEKMYSNVLDVRESTGNADRFNMTVILEKLNSDGTWDYTDLTNTLVVDEGSGLAGNFVKSTLIFDANLQEYRFRGGIKLVETGTFRMSFGASPSSNNIIELRSESPGQNLQMNIRTSSNNIDASGRYLFTVN